MSLVFDFKNINRHLNKTSRTDADILVEAREVLLPELRRVESVLGSDYEFDIRTDFPRFLLVVGLKKSTKQELGFSMYLGTIERGSYKTQFRTSLYQLVHSLK